MSDYDTIVRERQKDIRELIDANPNISIKAAWMKAGWKNPSTFLSYFPADGDVQPATMSVAALYRLLATKAVPAELLSLLLPDGFVIVQVPAQIDYDDISSACRDFIDAKERFHHPESEAGREIGPNEGKDLSAKVVRLRPAA